MDDRFNQLAQSLFQKSLKDSSVGEIQALANNYPYFAPAQFLLLKRLDPASEEYKAQYQKALLFHHDPLSFDAMINGANLDEEVLEFQQPEPAAPPSQTEITSPSPIVDQGNLIVEKAPTDEEVKLEHLAEEVTPVKEKQEPETKQVVPFNPAESVSGLTFEPFHTVDYFASQGIKLSQEETPKDQLGKQLKSFTEWLKTMKRLPATDLVKSIDVVAERKVENLAEDSVQNRDIVTEAMAEVWQRQGNHQKALEIYNKLSLQNPSKRAYFAAKIDSLKKSY